MSVDANQKALMDLAEKHMTDPVVARIHTQIVHIEEAISVWLKSLSTRCTELLSETGARSGYMMHSPNLADLSVRVEVQYSKLAQNYLALYERLKDLGEDISF